MKTYQEMSKEELTQELTALKAELFNLRFQNFQTGGFLRNLELSNCKMLLSAAALTALHIRISGGAYSVEEIILKDTVRFFQNRLSLCGQHGISILVQSRL